MFLISIHNEIAFMSVREAPYQYRVVLRRCLGLFVGCQFCLGGGWEIDTHSSYEGVLIPRTTMIHSKTNPELIKYGGACTLPSIHMERGRSRRE